MNNRCLLFFSLLILPGFVNAQINDSLKRKVFLQGAVNARDLGGYIGAEGKHVIWRKIYRSADISKLTQMDIDLLALKNTIDVVDLRGVKESAAAPDRLPPGKVCSFSCGK